MENAYPYNIKEVIKKAKKVFGLLEAVMMSGLKWTQWVQNCDCTESRVRHGLRTHVWIKVSICWICFQQVDHFYCMRIALWLQTRVCHLTPYCGTFSATRGWRKMGLSEPARQACAVMVVGNRRQCLARIRMDAMQRRSFMVWESGLRTQVWIKVSICWPCFQQVDHFYSMRIIITSTMVVGKFALLLGRLFEQ